MASWKLVDVPDSASEHVGQVLEGAGKIAQSALQKQAARIDDVADVAKTVIVAQIAKTAG